MTEGKHRGIAPASQGVDPVPARFLREHDVPEEARHTHRDAIVYLRNSVDRAITTEKSIEGQLHDLRQEAARNGLKIVAVFSDPGRTGMTRDGRPGLEAALGALEAKRGNILYVYDVARLSRIETDQFHIWYRVEAARATIHVHGLGHLNLDAYTMQCVVARAYRNVFLAQSDRGRRTAAMNGRVPHHPAFGYALDRNRPGEHYPHPYLSGAVLKIFEMLDAGIGATLIARFLTGKYPTPGRCAEFRDKRLVNDFSFMSADQLGTWKRHMVVQVARNPIYTGVIIFGKTRTERSKLDPKKMTVTKLPRSQWVTNQRPAPHLLMIERDLFDRVNERLDLRGGPKGAYAPKASGYLLTGKVHCAACGARMMARGYTESGKPLYFCESKIDTAECEGVGPHRVDAVERLVIAGIADGVLEPKFIAEFRGRVAEKLEVLQKQIDARRKELEARRAEIGKDLAESMDSRLNVNVPREIRDDYQAGLRVDYDRTNAEISALPVSIDVDKGFERLEVLSNALEWMAAQSPFRDTGVKGTRLAVAMRALVERVVVHAVDADGNVEVHVHANILSVLTDNLQIEGIDAPQPRTLSYRPADLRAVEEAELAQATADRLDREARSGNHELADEAWALVAPILDDFSVDEQVPGGARTLMNGLMFILKTGTAFNGLPSRFGPAEVFKSETKRLVWQRLWDEAIDTLRVHDASLLEGVEIGRLDSTLFPRTPYGGKRRVNLPGSEVLLALADVEGDDAVARRLRAVASCLDGKTQREAARAFGVALGSVGRWLAGFRRDGVSALTEMPTRPGRQPRLSEREVASLENLIAGGVDPDDPNRRITWTAIRAYCQREFNVHFVNKGLSELLRKNYGITMRNVIERSLGHRP